MASFPYVRNALRNANIDIFFCSLVSETIPDHRDYRTASVRDRSDYKKVLIYGTLNIDSS